MIAPPAHPTALSSQAWPEGALLATEICAAVADLARDLQGMLGADALTYALIQGRARAHRGDGLPRVMCDVLAGSLFSSSAHGALRKAHLLALLDRWVREGAAVPGLACRGLAPSASIEITLDRYDRLPNVHGRWGLLDKNGEPDITWRHATHPLLFPFQHALLSAAMDPTDALIGGGRMAAQQLLDAIDTLGARPARPDSPWWIFCGYSSTGVDEDGVRLFGKPIQADTSEDASVLGPLLSYNRLDFTPSPGSDILPFSHPHVPHMALRAPKPLVFDAPST